MHLDLAAKQWLNRAKRSAIWLAVLLVSVWLAWQALTGLIAAGTIPGLASGPVAPVKITQSPLPAENKLRILVIPPLDHGYAGDSAFLRLEIANDGDSAGTFSATGLAGHGCIRLDTAKTEGKPKATILADGAASVEIAAHATADLSIPVAAGCTAESLPQSIAVQLSYAWSIPAVPATRGKPGTPARSFADVVSTSPITVTSRDAEIKQRGLQVAIALAKDFTWPVLLALLGFFAQRALARRGERQQIFNTLLPAFTDLVQAHYLPIARRMEIVGSEAKRIEKKGAVAADVAKSTFSSIMLMRKRMQYLANTKGGIFFRSSSAEELFDDCFWLFYEQFQEATGNEEQCEALAVSLSPTLTLTKATDWLFSTRRTGATTPLYDTFTAWAVDKHGKWTGDFKSYLALVEVGKAVLSFECDRIYYQTDLGGVSGSSNWYFDPPQLEMAVKISDLPSTHREKILKLFKEYLDGIPKECRKNVAYPE